MSCFKKEIKQRGTLFHIGRFISLMAFGLISGCEVILCTTMVNCFDPYGRASLPPDTAYLKLKTPNYMDVHIYSIEEHYGYKAGVSFDEIVRTHTPGKLANGWSPPELLRETPRAPSYRGMFKSPRKFIVNWMSLPEGKAYKSTVLLRRNIYNQTTKDVETSCRRYGRPISSKRNIITLELAPGGKMKGWLSGVCLSAIEIPIKQGEPIPKKERTEYSDYAFKSYDPAPMDEYIKKHGIPYESWQ